jgi:hypothetical protein
VLCCACRCYNLWHVLSGSSGFGTYLLGGVIYLAKKIIKWWHFTFKNPENIICDGILHVNMFHYFTCTFFTKFTYNKYIGPYFYRTLFYDFRQWTPRACPIRWLLQTHQQTGREKHVLGLSWLRSTLTWWRIGSTEDFVCARVQGLRFRVYVSCLLTCLHLCKNFKVTFS